MRIESEQVKKEREEEKAQEQKEQEELLASQRKGGRENLKALHGRQKLSFIWDYYKLPLFLLFLALFIGLSFLHKKLTAKDPLLYVASINVNLGDTLPETFTEGYLHECEKNAKDEQEALRIAKKEQVVLYEGLYLTDDTSSEAFSYSYASRVKILASIDAGTLDVVLFDKEAFDAFAQNGFLYDLSTLSLDENLLVENIAIEEEEGSEESAESAEIEQGERKEELEAKKGQEEKEEEKEQEEQEKGKEEGTEKEEQEEEQKEEKKEEEKEEEQKKEEEKEKEQKEEKKEEGRITYRSYPMALDLSSSPYFSTYSGKVYAGILINTQRLEEAYRYLLYLNGESAKG